MKKDEVKMLANSNITKMDRVDITVRDHQTVQLNIIHYLPFNFIN